MASLTQAKLAEVVPAPGVNLAGRIECDDVGASSGNLNDWGARIAVFRNEFDFADLILGILRPTTITCASKDVRLAAEVVPVVERVMALLSTETRGEPAPAEDTPVRRQQESVELRECDLSDEVFRRSVLELVHRLVSLAHVVNLLELLVPVECLVATP